MIKLCQISTMSVHAFSSSLIQITLGMECNARTDSSKEKSFRERLKQFKVTVFSKVKAKGQS